MTKKNIALVGFMGVGKTLVSNKLGKNLRREVVSTDEEIVNREGYSINDIFAQKGESYFRQLEKAVVREVCGRQNIIIDCGGGIVMDEENFKILDEHCYMIYLEATVDTVYQNISHKKDRPLLKVDNPKAEMARLLEKRSPYYRKCAVTIDANNKTIDEMADEIQRLVREWEG